MVYLWRYSVCGAENITSCFVKSGFILFKRVFINREDISPPIGIRASFFHTRRSGLAPILLGNGGMGYRHEHERLEQWFSKCGTRTTSGT